MEVGLPSVNARCGSWQVAQATVPSTDSLPSKKSFWPSAIFSAVCGLSGGMAASVSATGKPTCLMDRGSASGPGLGMGGGRAWGEADVSPAIMPATTKKRTAELMNASPFTFECDCSGQAKPQPVCTSIDERHAVSNGCAALYVSSTVERAAQKTRARARSLNGESRLDQKEAEQWRWQLSRSGSADSTSPGLDSVPGRSEA